MFASVENYAAWKDNPNVNWISIMPDENDMEERRRLIREDAVRAGLPDPFGKTKLLGSEKVEAATTSVK